MPTFSSVAKQAYCVCLFCFRKRSETAAGCSYWILIKASLTVGPASFNWKENCLAFFCLVDILKYASFKSGYGAVKTRLWSLSELLTNSIIGLCNQ